MPVPPGFTGWVQYIKQGGKPVRHICYTGQDGNMVEDVKDAVKHQAKRTVEVATVGLKKESNDKKELGNILP